MKVGVAHPARVRLLTINCTELRDGADILVPIRGETDDVDQWEASGILAHNGLCWTLRQFYFASRIVRTDLDTTNMLWKLLLTTLVMVVSIHEAIGEDEPRLYAGPGRICNVDVVFVIDESWSVSSTWYSLAKQFAIDVLRCCGYLHDVWVGVIPYHCVPRTQVPLGPRDAQPIHMMMREGGLTRTGVAIRFMKDTSNFRDDVPRAAIVMTDGYSMDNVAAAATAAMVAGIQMYAVSLGDPGQVDLNALATIAGSPDRVFNMDNPCRVAFRILADLCKSSGVPGCYYAEKDAFLPLGSSFDMRPEMCGECNCSEEGLSCRAVGCPLRNPPCQNPVDIATRCCPVCADDGNVTVGCLYNGAIIPVGEEYKPDDCTTCTCPAAGAEPVCVAQACIALYCPNPVHIVGQCCPVCPGCLYDGVLIPVGSNYKPDPCTFCPCPYAGATVVCAVVDCAAPPCTNVVTPPGQCCPVCIGCEHDDGLILPGQEYEESPCVTCSCPAAGAEPLCVAMACMPLPCDDGNYISIAGQCCPVCDSDAPDGCLYRDGTSTILIPVGVDYKPTPCKLVQCFAAGDDPVVAMMDCAPPSCPDPVNIAGKCCPACLSFTYS
ncbi:hypothetical protein Bbelb_407920 [Branchiostoma belcheri]|nr:hypothetical protein Bbelb_407920 [Branchiostoma belcheri]